MNRITSGRIPASVAAVCALATMAPLPVHAAPKGPETQAEDAAGTDGAAGPDMLFHPAEVTTSGSVSVEGRQVAYEAHTGTLVVHPAGWDDTAWREKRAAGDKDDKAPAGAEASMFYVAYFKKGAPAADRPVMFLYNGGPGSATVWLHMGAFGPRRVEAADGVHTPAAPYPVVNNSYSLLDVADLVFIDAPGAGFSRVAGKDKSKAFWGIDQDAHAFEQFIKLFLTKYDRWNSPKYLFGESYGTPRSAVLVNMLQTNDGIDFNGVVLLSQILNFDLSIDGASFNPAIDTSFVAGLPTMAATAWYHDRLPGGRPAELEPFLREVEAFAIGDYASALAQGSALDPQKKAELAQRLAGYTGLPADYWMRSNLRVEGGQFEQQLQIASGKVTGRLDTRFSGDAMDVLDKETQYDPQSSAISSAYVSAFNDYARTALKWRPQEQFKIYADLDDWDMKHKVAGLGPATGGSANVMLDLAMAMKQNPDLKILLTGGYYDLATPYYEGIYEMRHLPIPDSLQGNIEYKYFASGHMVYANEDSLHGLHDTVAAFVGRTSHPLAR